METTESTQKETILREQQTKLVTECILGQDDETLEPLVRNIEQKLDQEGLNQRINTLGIPRFVSISQKNRDRIQKQIPFSVRVGKFLLTYHTRATDEKIDALTKLNRHENMLTIPSNIEGSSYYAGNKEIQLGMPPVAIATQISATINNERMPNYYHTKLGRGLGMRIHESAHHFNSDNSRAVYEHQKDQADTLIADIFREAHSCLVVQAYQINFEDKDFAEAFGNPERYNKMTPEEKENYFTHVGTHKEAVFSQDTKIMVQYTTDVIWQLRALGYDEAEIGKTIARFQKNNMLDWKTDTKTCSKVDKWLQQQWGYKGIVWNRQKVDESTKTVSEEVAKTKELFDRQKQKAQEIVLEASTEFLVRQEKPIVIWDHYSHGQRIDIELPNNMAVQTGEAVRVIYRPGLPSWNSENSTPTTYELEIINIKTGTTRYIETSNLESWFERGLQEYNKKRAIS